MGSDTICYNTIPSLLSSPLPSGGEESYTYQWYKDGDVISGATNSTYQPSALTSSSTYSVEVSDLCGTLVSNSINITVLPDLNPGSIIGDTVLCYNTSPSTIEMNILPLGGSNITYNYQWQYSIDSLNWINLNNEQNNFLDLEQLTISSYYRLRVNCGIFNCGPKYTNSIYIKVNDPLNPGLLTNQNICYGTSTLISFEENPSGGFESYDYQWQSSTDSINWINIGLNQSQLNTELLYSNIEYKVIINDECNQLESNSILINVYDSLQAGTILSYDTICYGTDLYQIDANYIEPVGGDLNYSYEWYYSSDGSSFDNIDVDPILQINNLIDTSYFFVKYISGSNCGEVNSNILKVTVHEELNPGSLIGDTTICYNTMPNLLSFGSFPNGGGDTIFNYQWQISFNNLNWTI